MDILTKLFDLILYPFRDIAPVWGIAFLSLLTAVFVLLVYKKVSNQDAIKEIKKKIQGYLLGLYLFRDDLSQILSCQWKVFSNTFRYMGHALRPLAVVIVPIALVCVQMQLRYGYSSLEPGDSVLVCVGLKKGPGSIISNVRLTVSDGLSVKSPALRLDALDEIDWKVGINSYGQHALKLKMAAEDIEKSVNAEKGVHRTYPVKAKASFWNSILYPGEQPISINSQVRYVRVDYPRARINVAGLKLHWSIIYFLLAIIFGLLLKRLFKVEF